MSADRPVDGAPATQSGELTAFEFALAGVAPPDGGGSGALAAIDDMRSLLDQTAHAPVKDRGLADFLDQGGPADRHGDRRERSRRARAATAGGYFVDITPSEFGDNASAGSDATQQPIDGGGIPARRVDDRPSTPAAVARFDDPDHEPPDLIITDEVAAARAEPPRPVDDDQVPFAPLGEPASDRPPSIAELDVSNPGDATAGGLGQGTGNADGEPTELVVGALLDGDDGSDPTRSDDASDGQPFDRPPAHDESDEDRNRELVGAAAPAGILSTSSASGFEPPAATATASGRSVGALLAVVGATALAAALVLGSLWWTSSSNPLTESGEAAPPGRAEAVDADLAADGTDSEPAATAESEGRLSADEGDNAEFGSDPAPTAGTETTIEVDAPTTASTAGPTTPSSVTTPGPADSTVGPASTPPTTLTTASTTAPPTTLTTASTIAPPISATPLSYIGDRVTVDNYDGPGLAGVEVSLLAAAGGDDDDDDDDERPTGSLVARAVTGDDGRYSFDVAAGCYVVRFDVPTGYTMLPRLAEQSTCVAEGEASARVDAFARAIQPVAAPSACQVDRSGTGSSLGVTVYEEDRRWADSYVFYDETGGVVARSTNLGQFNQADASFGRKWRRSSGLDHRRVWRATAVRDGVESSQVSCSRIG